MGLRYYSAIYFIPEYIHSLQILNFKAPSSSNVSAVTLNCIMACSREKELPVLRLKQWRVVCEAHYLTVLPTKWAICRAVLILPPMAEAQSSS